MFWLRGALGYLLLNALLASAAHAGALLAARALRIEFRWFDSRPADAPLWRRFCVRLASSLAPLVATVLFLFLIFWLTGTQAPSTRVVVQPEAAAAAGGIRTGDRILSVDGRPISSFEALPLEIRRDSRERKIEVERQARKFVLLVTPRNGRIGVSPLYEQQELSAGAAFKRALDIPRSVQSGVLKTALGQGRTTLVGPVGIVRESKSQTSSGSFLLFLAYVAAFFWPLAAGVHAYDALTSALFRATHPWAPESAARALAARLARIYQTLLVSLLTTATFVALAAIQTTAFGDGALLGLWILAPAACACTLLAAITAYLRWGYGIGTAALAASLLVPCCVFAVAAWSIYWIRLRLSSLGFRTNWFVVNEKEPAESS